MKVYTYSDAEVAGAGIAVPTSFDLRLAGTVPTTNPADADVFVSSVLLANLLDRAAMARLPHFAAHEARHVFLDMTDLKYEYGSTALLIRCCLNQLMLEDDLRSLAWPWPVEDFGEQGQVLPVPAGGFHYDATFHGWRSSNPRRDAVNSCRTVLGDRFDVAEHAEHFGQVDDCEAAVRRAAYVASLRDARLSLCPESDQGVLPYRFYEALSAGRPPVLFSTGYVLPWADEIPWVDIAFIYPEADASRAGEIIEDVLHQHNDDDLRARGQLGREWWRRRLDRSQWDMLFTLAVQRDFTRRGLL
jgi:glycosyltransferase involved in cell wall biosynthesis